jgi:hypothetical protein
MRGQVPLMVVGVDAPLRALRLGGPEASLSSAPSSSKRPRTVSAEMFIGKRPGLRRAPKTLRRTLSQVAGGQRRHR